MKNFLIALCFAIVVAFGVPYIIGSAITGFKEEYKYVLVMQNVETNERAIIGGIGVTKSYCDKTAADFNWKETYRPKVGHKYYCDEVPAEVLGRVK